MKTITKTLAVATVAATLALSAAPSYAANDTGNDNISRELAAMHWQSGQIEIPDSHSKITLGMNFKTVTGTEAQRLRVLIDGVTRPGLEAEAVDYKAETDIMYQYFNEGYVSLDDWANIDPDALLAQIKENDVEANKERRAHGISQMHTIGWVEKPSLNRDTNTVSWIIRGEGDDGSKVINAVALKLGRNGYERIVWIADPNSLSSSLDGFRAAINSHEFNSGYRYVDHVATDRAATYGIAGLVAGVLGVKAAKTIGIGGAAVLAVLAKKLGALIIVPFVAAGAFFRRIFRRTPRQS